MTTAASIQEFADHPLWRTAAELVTRAKEASPRDSTSRHTLARVLATAEYVRLYRSTDPHLMPNTWPSYADQLNSYVAQLADQLDGWDEAAAMTGSTVAQLDAICTQVMSSVQSSTWPPLFKESRAAAISGAAEAFRTAAEASLEALQSDVQDAVDRLTDLKTDVDLLDGRASKAETRVSAAADSVEEEVTASRKRAQEALEDLLEQTQDLIDQDEQKRSAQVAAFLKQLGADAQRGQDLVKLVGDQATGGGYDTFARAELRAYRFWSGVGVSVSLLAVGYLFLALFVLQHVEELSPQAVILRGALSLPVLAVAGYAFQQAGRRQKQSVEARYRALDVLAVEPFTNGMSEDQQSDLRALLGRRLFAAATPEVTQATGDETPLPSASQVQQLVDVIKLLRGGG